MDLIGTMQIGSMLVIFQHVSNILGEVCEHDGSLLKYQMKVNRRLGDVLGLNGR